MMVFKSNSKLHRIRIEYAYETHMNHANLNEIRKDKKVNLENCGLNQFERAGFFIKDINTDPKKNI